MGEVLDHILLASNFSELIDDLEKGVQLLSACSFPLHHHCKVYLHCSHQRLDEIFQEGIKQGGLFLVLLEDEADPIPHLFEGELVEGLHPNGRVGLAVLVLEVETHVFDILGEGSLLLHEEVGILRHALVGLLFSCSLCPIYHPLAPQLCVLEVLVGLLEVQKLRFYVKARH